MSATVSRDATIVFNRFGLGARTGDLVRPGQDPRGFLATELQADKALIALDPAELQVLGSTVANLQTAYAAQEARKEVRQQTEAAAAPMAGVPGSMAVQSSGPPMTAAQDKPKPAEPSPENRIYRAEALARLQKGAAAEIGFVERLVAFWSNHFCVSVSKSDLVRATAGSFEREAIRPFVLGRFADMLMAVEHHPAMLAYLDNAQSVGPDSRAGQNRKRGLNENFAREILELHTLGVGAGYSQADVTSLARIVTGWTVAGRDGRLGEPGSFVFNAAMHEPGDQMVVGRAYLEGGFGQGEAALNDIARHPATAHHIATKLVRHFVADDPPPAAVDRIAATFRTRDGDLKAVALALVNLPEAWSSPLTKIRNPHEYLLGVTRLLGGPVDDSGPVLNGLRTLGMPLWEPPGPNGFPDDAAAWASPESLKLRLDLSAQIARRANKPPEPLDLLETMAGEEASAETRTAIGRAESREQALALLLMSPEFQRR